MNDNNDKNENPIVSLITALLTPFVMIYSIVFLIASIL